VPKPVVPIAAEIRAYRCASALGHPSTNVTLDLCSHVTETMQEDAAAKLDMAFRTAISAVRK
jgi:hypothetical protein